MVHHLLLGNPNLPLGNAIASKVNFTRLSSAVAAASRLLVKPMWVRKPPLLLNSV
jgi:hypothetical protein